MTWTTTAWLISFGFAATATARIAEYRFAGACGRFAWEILATALLLSVLAARESDSIPFICGASVCIALVAAGSVDARTGYLADTLTAPAALLALARASSAGSAIDAVAAVAVYVGGFALTHCLSKGATIGLGDVKTLFAIATAFGVAGTAVALFVASVSGLIVLRINRRWHRGAALHFGPHLALGATSALLAAGA
jgi:prepilin signal peptidase PulO-like enzyme (type II secretory pathway)